MSASSTAPRRAYWLKTLHEWHWVSSALCLVGMLLFSITGITLNHAGQIEAKPAVTQRTATLEPALRAQLEKMQPEMLQARKGKAPLPVELQRWASRQWQIETAERDAEWSEDEVYLSLPGLVATPGCVSTSATALPSTS